MQFYLSQTSCKASFYSWPSPFKLRFGVVLSTMNSTSIGIMLRHDSIIWKSMNVLRWIYVVVSSPVSGCRQSHRINPVVISTRSWNSIPLIHDRLPCPTSKLTFMLQPICVKSGTLLVQETLELNQSWSAGRVDNTLDWQSWKWSVGGFEPRPGQVYKLCTIRGSVGWD